MFAQFIKIKASNNKIHYINKTLVTFCRLGEGNGYDDFDDENEDESAICIGLSGNSEWYVINFSSKAKAKAALNLLVED